VVGEAMPASGGTRVVFELPVALPPPGTYAVRIETSGTSIDARASVDGAGLELERPLRGRVRVEFG
jgi:hypothetical protein